MATETTRLLNGCVINIPEDKGAVISNNVTKGLSLEELMPYDNDPWWQNLRRTFFLSFWVTLIVIFMASCIISVLEHGTCPARIRADHISQISQALAILTPGSNGTTVVEMNRTEPNIVLAL